MRKFFSEGQLAHNPRQELHNGNWVAYTDVPARARDIAAKFDCLPAKDFGLEPISSIHTSQYLTFLQTAWREWKENGRGGDAIPYTFPVSRRRQLDLNRIDAKLGLHSFDAATPIAQHSWDAAYWSAQTARTGLDHINKDGVQNAFALCRPPGHHAGRDYMGGYCYLNNAAIAAQRAHDLGMGPVAIVDVDYHHGNGTQDIFYEDENIFFSSIHAHPRTDYPFYWGHADEIGAGPGEGSTLNLPLQRGAAWPEYQMALDQAGREVANRGTKLLILSFGADTFEGDPISHFKLKQSDFLRMGSVISQWGIPTLIVMEGGYAVKDLGSNVATFLSGFET